MLSQLDSDQGTTTTIFFVPNSIQKYRGATVPQITTGAKEKEQPYLGDLSIIISVRYHTHTHTHPNTNMHILSKKRSPKTTAKLIQNNVYCFFITIFRLSNLH